MAKYIPPRIPLRKQIEPRAEKALAFLVEDLVQVMIDAMDEVAYYWDRRTVRSTGEIAGSPRNIVDTGELRDSLRLHQITKQRYDLVWHSSYAAINLLGGILRSDGSVSPGRDWIGWGLSSVDLLGLFVEYFRRG